MINHGKDNTYLSPRRDTTANITKRYKIPKKDLVEDKHHRATNGNNSSIDISKLRSIVNSTSDSISSSKSSFQLLPDLKFVMEILMASILSPKELAPVKLNINLNNACPPNLAEHIREHFTKEYDLEGRLHKILSESLFTIGSYSTITIPTKLISDLINSNTVSLEGFNDNDANWSNIGILGDECEFNLESLTDTPRVKLSSDKNLILSDHPGHLIQPYMDKTIKKINTNIAMESIYGTPGNDNDPVSVYMRRSYKQINNQRLTFPNPDETRSDLNPIVIELPAEAIIPVYIPGNVREHIGYYVVTDESGHPISNIKDTNHFKNLNDRLKTAIKSNGTGVIDKRIMDNNSSYFTKPIIDSYVKEIELKLKNAVKEGIHGKDVELTAPNDLYKLMLSRQLANQRTKVIYVSGDKLNYIAFNYNSIGIGISLLEMNKLYTSLRSLLMFSKLMATVKNAVPSSELEIILDEHETDPQAVVEQIINEYTSLQTTELPIGSSLEASDMVDSIQKSGIQVKIDGGERFPGTKINRTDTNRDIKLPEDQISEELKIQHYAGLMLTRESVEHVNSGYVTTGLTNRDLVQSRRHMLVQDEFTPQVSSFIHNYIYAGGKLYYECMKMYNEWDGKDNCTFNDMVNSITVTLPKPDNAVLNAQLEQYKDYSEIVEKVVDDYINDDMFNDIVESDAIEDIAGTVRSNVISILKRKFLNENNMFPEIDKLIVKDNKELSRTINIQSEAVLNTAFEVVKSLRKKEDKWTKAYDKLKDKFEGNDDEENTNKDDTTDTDSVTDDIDDISNSDTDNDVPLDS